MCPVLRYTFQLSHLKGEGTDWSKVSGFYVRMLLTFQLLPEVTQAQ